MTRRDYELISNALRKAKPGPCDGHEYQVWGWERAVETMAHALKERNPLFDEKRFARDCGAQR